MLPDRVSNPGILTYVRVRCPTDCATRPGIKCPDSGIQVGSVLPKGAIY